VLENHPAPPVQVSKEAKVANRGPHRKMSIKAVVAVITLNKSKNVAEEAAASLADMATI
jgi:hypothetical protein